MLEKRKNEGGMDFKELKDSYSKLTEAVNELAAEGRILVVRNKDGAPRVLFWNDQRYNTAMDPSKKKKKKRKKKTKKGEKKEKGGSLVASTNLFYFPMYDD